MHWEYRSTLCSQRNGLDGSQSLDLRIDRGTRRSFWGLVEVQRFKRFRTLSLYRRRIKAKCSKVRGFDRQRLAIPSLPLSSPPKQRHLPKGPFAAARLLLLDDGS